MRNCEFCGSVNADVADHCGSCGEPLTADAARADEKKAEQRSRQALVRREIVYGLVAVGLAGAIGGGIWMKRSGDAARSEARDFYTSFRGPDEEHALRFWRCVTRNEKLPQDNLQLEQALELAVMKSGGGYARHATERCLPLLDKAPQVLGGLTAPAPVAPAYSEYVETLAALASDARRYAEAIGALEVEGKRDEALKRLGNNYHYAEKESAETWAYDRFLRCALPDFDALADTQALLESLHGAMKDPVAPVARWRKECFPLVEKTEGTTAHEDYKKKVEAFSSDDRDVQAFQDVLEAADAKERKRLHHELSQSWYAYAQKRDALTAALGGALGD